MSNHFHNVIKNALFTMADLFLDFVQEGATAHQQGNIAAFIIDCHNVDEGTPEFLLLQGKFEEEFSELHYFETMNKDELTSVIQESICGLFHTLDEDDAPIIPLLVQNAIDHHFA